MQYSQKVVWIVIIRRWIKRYVSAIHGIYETVSRSIISYDGRVCCLSPFFSWSRGLMLFYNEWDEENCQHCKEKKKNHENHRVLTYIWEAVEAHLQLFKEKNVVYSRFHVQRNCSPQNLLHTVAPLQFLCLEVETETLPVFSEAYVHHVFGMKCNDSLRSLNSHTLHNSWVALDHSTLTPRTTWETWFHEHLRSVPRKVVEALKEGCNTDRSSCW